MINLPYNEDDRFYGKRIGDMTREELMGALTQQARLYMSTLDSNKRTIEMFSTINKARK